MELFPRIRILSQILMKIEPLTHSNRSRKLVPTSVIKGIINAPHEVPFCGFQLSFQRNLSVPCPASWSTRNVGS